jgi:hypothetical protein
MDSAVTSTECRTRDGPAKLTVHVPDAAVRSAYHVRLLFAQQWHRQRAAHSDRALTRHQLAQLVEPAQDDVELCYLGSAGLLFHEQEPLPVRRQ